MIDLRALVTDLRRSISAGAPSWLLIAVGIACLPFRPTPIHVHPALYECLLTMAVLLHLFAAQYFISQYRASRSAYSLWGGAALFVLAVALAAQLGLMWMPLFNGGSMLGAWNRSIWLWVGGRLCFYVLAIVAISCRPPASAATHDGLRGSEIVIRGSLLLMFLSLAALIAGVGLIGSVTGLFHAAYTVPASLGGRLAVVVLAMLALLCVGTTTWRARSDGIPQWLTTAAVAAAIATWLSLLSHGPGTVGHYLACAWVSVPALIVCVSFHRRSFEAQRETAKEHGMRSDAPVSAARDSLTGLYDWKPFVERLERELLAAAGGRGPPLSLMLVDISQLHRWNVARGYLFGDTLLATVAHAVRTSVRMNRGRRDVDFAARLGGKIAVVLHDADEHAVELIGQRIRLAISREFQILNHQAQPGGPPTIWPGTTSRNSHSLVVGQDGVANSYNEISVNIAAAGWSPQRNPNAGMIMADAMGVLAKVKVRRHGASDDARSVSAN